METHGGATAASHFGYPKYKQNMSPVLDTLDDMGVAAPDTRDRGLINLFLPCLIKLGKMLWGPLFVFNAATS